MHFIYITIYKHHHSHNFIVITSWIILKPYIQYLTRVSTGCSMAMKGILLNVPLNLPGCCNGRSILTTLPNLRNFISVYQVTQNYQIHLSHFFFDNLQMTESPSKSGNRWHFGFWGLGLIFWSRYGNLWPYPDQNISGQGLPYLKAWSGVNSAILVKLVSASLWFFNFLLLKDNRFCSRCLLYTSPGSVTWLLTLRQSILLSRIMESSPLTLPLPMLFMLSWLILIKFQDSEIWY